MEREIQHGEEHTEILCCPCIHKIIVKGARAEERERLLNQKANQHDQEVRKEERERIKEWVKGISTSSFVKEIEEIVCPLFDTEEEHTQQSLDYFDKDTKKDLIKYEKYCSYCGRSMFKRNRKEERKRLVNVPLQKLLDFLNNQDK